MADPQMLAQALMQQGQGGVPAAPAQPSPQGGSDPEAALQVVAQAMGVPLEVCVQALTQAKQAFMSQQGGQPQGGPQ